MALLVQSIRRGAAVWQSKYDPANAPGARFSIAQIGAFDRQQHALSNLEGANFSAYRTTEYWNNSQDVQPKFLLKDQYFNGRLRANGVQGWFEICMVTPRRHFIDKTTLRYQMPNQLQGMVYTCEGSDDCQVINSQVFSVKVLKRFHFDQEITVPTQQDPTGKVYGEEQKTFRLHIKSNNVIAVADTNATGQVYDWTDIPTEQHSYLVFRTTVKQDEIQGQQVPGSNPPIYYPPGSFEGRRLELQLRRVVKWADQTGNSLA